VRAGRFHRFAAFAAFAAGALLLPVTRGAEPALSLPQVLAEVQARNPQIRSAAATAAADRERIAQAGAWEDPVAGFELQRESSNRLSTYDAAELSVTQKIPLSGNRTRRRALAAAEADVSAATIRTRELMLLGQARDAFFQLWGARAQLALTRETEKLLDQAVEITRSRLASGAGNVSALLLAASERARLEERVIVLEREIADAAAALNTVRDLPPQAAVGPLAAPAEHLTLPFATLDEAQAHALTHRPEMDEAAARIAAAERARDLADRAWRPDPEVMLKARHLNTGSRAIEGYDTGVAVSLPWFNSAKYRSAQREADRRREAAELDSAALRTRTAAEVREMWQRLDAARRTTDLYRTKLLPLARQSADAARQNLVNGSTTIAELVMAQRTLVEAETTLAASTADFHRYSAMLQTLTGTNVP
jgi:cobalt-zinc-cadmium efflux system outer membrane protein